MSENQQYEQLEHEIDKLRDIWASAVNAEKLLATMPTVVRNLPLIPHLNILLPTEQYKEFITDLLNLLVSHQPELQPQATVIVDALSPEVLEEWFVAMVKVNSFYFEQFAEKQSVAPWLPYFVAENAARPYLKAVAGLTSSVLSGAEANHGCPACGEPARLAVISKKGKKEIVCPRCEHAWEEKKISCAHCGTEDHEQLEVLKLEGNESAEIHVCHSCKGYTKVVDVRKMFKKESPQLLDTKSIHLDYIAQERGFGIPVVNVTN